MRIDPAHVPLLRRAYELWREAEAASSLQLLVITGSLDASPEWDPLFQSAMASACQHDLAHEVLTGAQINERLPGYCLLPTGPCSRPREGLVASERAMVAHTTLAQSHGVVIKARERVLGCDAHPGGAGATVTTGRPIASSDPSVA